MNTLNKTPLFDRWLSRLSDLRARVRILNRLDNVAAGNLGDHKPVGGGVSELRIDYGPGYRIYYAQEGRTVYLLLLGGDKRTQSTDIEKAKALWDVIKRRKNDQA